MLAGKNNLFITFRKFLKIHANENKSFLIYHLMMRENLPENVPRIETCAREITDRFGPLLPLVMCTIAGRLEQNIHVHNVFRGDLLKLIMEFTIDRTQFDIFKELIDLFP